MGEKKSETADIKGQRKKKGNSFHVPQQGEINKSHVVTTVPTKVGGRKDAAKSLYNNKKEGFCSKRKRGGGNVQGATVLKRRRARKGTESSAL